MIEGGAASDSGHCLHCGVDVAGEARFCCSGCEAAYETVTGMGLEAYYQRRCLDPDAPILRPDALGPPLDYGIHVHEKADGTRVLHLMVEGLQCAACVWLIESVLSRQQGVVSARVNMTTRRLVLEWRGPEQPDTLVASVGRLGYRLVPYDPALLDRESRNRERELLWAMAVAGFAAGNVMLLSVSLWAGYYQDMEPVTRDLLHWVSALIALPAVAYAGVPFFRSAVGALRGGGLNMDVPISLAVTLAAGMSLFETMRGGEHAYFDSAVTLLFFLLVGRYLDQRARSRARSAGEHLLALNATAVTIVDESGACHVLPPSRVHAGMIALAAAGERVAVDGTIVAGSGEVDTSLVTGETLPRTVVPGQRVFAGTLAVSGPLRIRVDAVGEETLLAEIVRLMEAAEQGRAHYVALADRVARWYAPVVHGLALATFLGWFLIAGVAWQESLLTAIAVLIITCPCALALAVPVVQVIASGRLLRQGILVKSATALERLAEVDTVVFDKTGTLTLGRAELVAPGAFAPEDLEEAASLALASRHPLARALVRAAGPVTATDGVEEVPGLGLRSGQVRLGSRAWVGVAETSEDGVALGPELWLGRPDRAPVRFAFTDRAREDASRVVTKLKESGMVVWLLSGDRSAVAGRLARQVGIDRWLAEQTPSGKHDCLQALARDGRRVLMVGDGLNDAPALSAAHVSMSPSTAMDVSQTAADLVFQGVRLAPVLEALEVAGHADRLIKQNFVLALLYNGITVPLAVAGMLTPLFAAVAMSTSSLVVIANALRLNKGQDGRRNKERRTAAWTFS